MAGVDPAEENNGEGAAEKPSNGQSQEGRTGGVNQPKDRSVEGTQDAEKSMKQAQRMGKLIEDTTKTEDNAKHSLRDFKNQYNAGNKNPENQ